MKCARYPILIALFYAGPAYAGPPFDTDDPEPTGKGQFELYLATSVDGAGHKFEGETEAEVNFGAARNLQLTASVPLDYANGAKSMRGLGDIELAAKYRFINNEKSGFSVAAFPNITLPTGTNGFSANHVTALFPVWAQKTDGKWTLFGGGGFAINPGTDNRNYWVGGVAFTRDFGERLNIGVEATREGPTFMGDKPTNTLGIGVTRKLDAPFSLLLRGGPSWEAGSKADYHLYAALGLDF